MCAVGHYHSWDLFLNESEIVVNELDEINLFLLFGSSEYHEKRKHMEMSFNKGSDDMCMLYKLLAVNNVRSNNLNQHRIL